jgi:hypothetical protein
MFSPLAIPSWMQPPFRLWRASGTMNALVMHGPADLGLARPAPIRSAGPKGCLPTPRPG